MEQRKLLIAASPSIPAHAVKHYLPGLPDTLDTQDIVYLEGNSGLRQEAAERCVWPPRFRPKLDRLISAHLQDVRKRYARNRDAQLPHGSEVRQTTVARCMVLGEEHFLCGPLHGSPLANVTLQGTQRAVGEVVGVIVLEFAQQGDGHQLGGAFEKRDDFSIPDL